LQTVVDARRVEMDWEAYQRLVRRACFVCELLAGNPDYPHRVVYRDGAAVAFLSRFPWWPGHLLVAPATHVEDVVLWTWRSIWPCSESCMRPGGAGRRGGN
jgi:galactose-1-phosphate uridylyltransferase